MPGSTGNAERLTTLWQLGWEENLLSCVVYRDDRGLRMTIESRSAVIVTEAFDLQPRMVARAEALRSSLKRRGWRDC